MSLRTPAQIKLPDIGKIQDPSTKMVLDQLLRFMYDNQSRLYDDLKRLENLPEYADNAAALAGGLKTGAFYRTTDTVKVVHA